MMKLQRLLRLVFQLQIRLNTTQYLKEDWDEELYSKVHWGFEKITYPHHQPSIDPNVEVVSAMEDQHVAENQPVEFICQYSRPVKAIWKRNGIPVQADGRRVIVEQDWTVARLYISCVEPQDGGMYSCEAEGTSVVAHLRVQGERTCRRGESVCHS